MSSDPPPPRRRWHLHRWLSAFVAALLAYGGWTEYDFRSALNEAYALGWRVSYTDPVAAIRRNWRAVFQKETWTDGVTVVAIPTGDVLEKNRSLVRRLNPRELRIQSASTLRDFSALDGLSRLKWLFVKDGTSLKDLDGLKNLRLLQRLSLTGHNGLANIDALNSLTALEWVYLEGCADLTNVEDRKSVV